MSEIFLCLFPRVEMRTPTAPADKVQGLTGNQTSKMSLVARSFSPKVSGRPLGSAHTGTPCFFGVFPSSWRPETRETYVAARPAGFSVYQVGSSGHVCTSLGTQVAPVALAGA